MHYSTHHTSNAHSSHKSGATVNAAQNSAYSAPQYSSSGVAVMQMAKGGGTGGKKAKKSGGGGAASAPTGVSRGKFSDDKKDAARLETELSHEADKITDAGAKDLSAPHRLPWGAIKNIVLTGDMSKIQTMHDELTTGSKEIEARLLAEGKPKSIDLEGKYKKTRERLEKNWASFKTKKSPTSSEQQSLIDHFNNLASNAPGYGPHSTVNERVGDLLHINVEGAKGAKNKGTDAPLTPRSRAAVRIIQGTKHPVSIAVNSAGKVITPSGELVDFAKVKEIQKMSTQKVTRPVDGKTVYDGSYLPKALPKTATTSTSSTASKTPAKTSSKNDSSRPSWVNWLIGLGVFTAAGAVSYFLYQHMKQTGMK